MPAWRSHQRDMAAAALGGNDAAIARIGARATGRIGRALAVHRSTTIDTLTGALAAAYPSVRRTLGAARFSALAADHVRERPPRRPDLLGYGRDFPETLQARSGRLAPVGLIDIALMDRAWLDAFHAADAAVLTPAALVERTGADGAPRPRLHPSAVRLDPAVGNLARWRALAADPGHDDRDEPGADGRHVLVVRPEAGVVVLSLAPGTAALLDRLAAGDDLITAFAAATARHRAIDAEAMLSTLFAVGAFADDGPDDHQPEG